MTDAWCCLVHLIKCVGVMNTELVIEMQGFYRVGRFSSHGYERTNDDLCFISMTLEIN